MKRHTIVAALMVAALASEALAFQGPPVAPEDRNVGLQVREMTEGLTTALDGSPLITITAAPGANYQLFGSIGSMATLADLATPFTLGRGAFCAPLSLLGPPTFGVTTGSWGLIPPTGRQDIVLTVPIPPGFGGIFFDLQLLVQQPDGSYDLSNGQLRQVQAAPPPAFGWLQSADYPQSLGSTTWVDIEQGDVDGDGDSDTIGVGDNVVQLWRTTGGMRVIDPAIVAGSIQPIFAGGTSAELADLDNDGWLDLAVSFIAGPRHLRIWLNRGLSGTGAWLGFNELAWTNIVLGAAADPADLEIGFLNDDEFRDIFLACAQDPLTGQRNRILFGGFIPPIGDPTISGPTMTDSTAASLPDISDDSEDCEIFDFDLDGDFDVAIANFDGDASIFGTGVDYLLVNQGGAQGGVEGTFLAPNPNPHPAVINDESLDVVVGDFDADGLPDLYYANWALTNPSGSLAQPFTAVRDRIYLRRGPAGAPFYVDFSDQLLPDGPIGLVPPTFGTDAEAFDFDFDGDIDIVVPMGTLVPIAGTSIPGVPGSSLGIEALMNPGITRLNIPQVLLVPIVLPQALSEDFRDVEPGDWREAASPMVGPFGLYFDEDLGCATGGTTIRRSLFSLDHL